MSEQTTTPLPHNHFALTVFCGSRRVAPKYLQLATRVGHDLAGIGIPIIYGGGGTGLMGEMAKAALARGGQVYGVMPHFLRLVEGADFPLTQIIYTDNLHQRKEIMSNGARAFLILPGGLGTLEEMFEILSWRILRQLSAPIFLLDKDGFWQELMIFLQKIQQEKFLDANFFNDHIYEIEEDWPTLLRHIEALFSNDNSMA